MPTLEELFRNKKYERLGDKTPQEAFDVRNSKDIQISTISSLLNNTSVPLINKIRLGKATERFRETRVESELVGLLPFANFSSAILYGTDILRISSQNTSLGEAMKAGTGGRGLVATAARVAGDTIGEAVQFGGSRLLKVPSTFNAKTAITRAGAAIKNTIGALFPDVLIPSKIITSPVFNVKLPGFGEEYRVHERLASLQNLSAGTKVASFLAKNATGTPDQIKQAVIGQGLNIAQQQAQKFVSNQLVKVLSKGGDKAQQMAKELQQSQLPSLRWSSLKKYSDVVQNERQFGKPPLNFSNQAYTATDTSIDDRLDLSTLYNIKFDGTANSDLIKSGKARFLKEKNQAESNYIDGASNGVWKYSSVPRTKYRTTYGIYERRDVFNEREPYNTGTDAASIKRDDEYDKLDMIPLKFVSVGNSSAVNFRGTITGLSEQFSPSWDSSRFIGSPFNFYTYQSIERTVQFSFKVFSLSNIEHKNNWSKLAYLSSLCYPQQYTGGAGAVTAPFLKFTMGDMYRDRECFIENMSYNIDDNYPWEIGLNRKDLQNYRLPMIVEVTITLKFVEVKSNTHTYELGADNKLNPARLGKALYGYSEKLTDFGTSDKSIENEKQFKSTNKPDVKPDPLKPKSEDANKIPYPQDETNEALKIQKEYQLRKTNIPYTPPDETKLRTIYRQRKTGKLYFGDGTPYNGLGKENAGPDLSFITKQDVVNNPFTPNINSTG